MTITPHLLSTFGLLAMTIVLLWIPLPAIRGNRASLWCGGLVLAIGAGLHGGILDWRAPLSIAVFAALAWSAREAGNKYLRALLLTLTALIALALAMHKVPGFHNPMLAEGIHFSSDGAPFSLWANFDKAVVGIILVGVFCDRIGSRDEWLAMARRIAPVVLSSLILVLGLGWLLGQVRPDLKWTQYSAWFLASNLLITCVAEEAFFRGFLLQKMAWSLRGWRGGAAIAALATSILFGLAHLGGGVLPALLATVAGTHYAAAYLLSKRVEGAILAHFTLNAVHFLALLTRPWCSRYGDHWPTQMILVSYSCALPFFFAAHVTASSASATVMTVALSLFLMNETPSKTPSLLRMTLAKTGGLLPLSARLFCWTR